MKRILSVGQCSKDHSILCRFVDATFHATVVPVATSDEAVARLSAEPFDLVLVNRQLDADATEGTEVIERIKSNANTSGVAAMLVSNFADAQAAACAVGAEPGFGKTEYGQPKMVERLEKHLGPRRS